MVLFFYPLDFTFVCPTGMMTCSLIKMHLKYQSVSHNSKLYFHIMHLTEITAFSDRYAEFEELNTEVIGISIDSVVCTCNVCFI